MKVDILAFGAHPDDIEISCAGTLCKAVAEGKKVVLIDLTRGENGTRGTIFDRSNEAINAAKIIGAEIRENLEMPDGGIFNNEMNRLKVMHAIRKYQPEIVIGNAPYDRHPDHGQGGQLVKEACFLAGLKKVKTYENGDEQEPWRPKAFYQYIQYQHIQPDFVVDITGYMDQKIDSLKAHKSQFFDPDSTEPRTVISDEGFFDAIKSRDREFGRQIFSTYAEGFIAERFIGVNSLFDLI